MMARLNLKLLLLIVAMGVAFVSLSLWATCGGNSSHLRVPSARSLRPIQRQVGSRGRLQPGVPGEEESVLAAAVGYEEIDCRINAEYSVSCRKEGDEIFVPFSFLHKYFEVYGKLASYDGLERFEWSHSYSKVYTPKGRYNPRGIFMYFENYNVEVRDRVKCVSASEGVPVSTQWEISGYFYPTQVAQFGLAHYSRNLTEPEPRRRVLEDGSSVLAAWNVPHGAAISRMPDNLAASRVLRFSAQEGADSMTGVTLRMDQAGDFVLSLSVRLRSNASISVSLQNRDELFSLRYICGDDRMLWTEPGLFGTSLMIAHGLGRCTGTSWLTLARDLVIDLQKGLFAAGRPRRKLSRSRLRILGITLHGSGSLDNLTVASTDHMANFYAAARWFVTHQSPHGGWEIPVKRRLAPGMSELAPGWLSAMSQGHAISVLARAYHHSGDQDYLRAAELALKPFTVPSAEGGVKAEFMGGQVWYEEYPTTPPSFVLNGFIYALLGLYDLWIIGDSSEAAHLYEEGVRSLRSMLLLYDTGSGTTYDLRHLGMGCAPNLARWDYHATHVNQLLLLATIEKDPLFAETAERWAAYMVGKRAAHN